MGETSAGGAIAAGRGEGSSFSRFALSLGLLIVGAFPGVVIGTQSFFRFDYGVLIYPVVHYQREAFWRGEIPFWNPLVHCGVPFLAQWSTMVLYPPALLYVLLPLPWSLGLFCLLHLLAGGLGTYKLCREWTGDGFAASIAGTSFVFCGVTLSCLMWPQWTAALGLMPWVVLFARSALATGGLAVIVSAMVSAMQILTGVPEVIVLTWIVIVMLPLADPGLRTAAGTRPRSIARLGAVIAVASGLTAVQILPFLTFLARSQRGSGFIETRWSLPLSGWANLLVPLFRCGRTPQGFYVPLDQGLLPSVYIGPAVLSLALVAGIAWALRRGRLARSGAASGDLRTSTPRDRAGAGGGGDPDPHRDRLVPLLLALAALGLILALGRRLPFYELLSEPLAFLVLVRYPVKFATLSAFVLPAAAAFGVAWMARTGSQSQRMKTTVVLGSFLAISLLACLVLVAEMLRPNPYESWTVLRNNTVVRVLLGALIVGTVAIGAASWHGKYALLGSASRFLALLLLAFDGLTHVPNLAPRIPASLLVPGWEREHAGIDPPPSLAGPRVLLEPGAARRLYLSKVADWEEEWTLRRRALWSHLNMLDGIPKVSGIAPLSLREATRTERRLLVELEEARESRTRARSAADTREGRGEGLLDFLGVGYVLAPDDLGHWLRRGSALPLAGIGCEPVFRSGDEALAALLSADFDPRAQVLLPSELAGTIHAHGDPGARILSSEFRPGRVRVVEQSSGPAILTIAQSFDDRWRARIDGQEAPLFRANVGYQGIEVPAGRHTIEVTYTDRGFWIGALVSALTLVFCAATIARRVRTPR